MALEVILERFPELKHFRASDRTFYTTRGPAATQLLADLACQNEECRRVGDIGVFKCAACGQMKTAYAPDVLGRMRQNKLA
eukprot:15461627-Alexandrium_andersonii.AAC.1